MRAVLEMARGPRGPAGGRVGAGTVLRLPVRHIRALLLLLSGGEISSGEIVEVLHRVVSHAKPVVEAIKGPIRASPAVQAEERGNRMAGRWGARLCLECLSADRAL